MFKFEYESDVSWGRRQPTESARQNHVNDLALYEEVLSDFLKNPTSRANLP